MSNQMPIYSQVVPKSQFRGKNSKGMATRESRGQNLARADFDPLNFNHGGNIQLMNAPLENRIEKLEKRESRRKEETSRSRRKNDSSEGKVEAYLRQNQVSMRQQQHRHSAVRQAEHRVNLRSLPLNEISTPRGHDRTPTDRHRGFPERERDGSREYRRERERDKDRERDNFDFDGTPLSPIASRAHDKDSSRPVRKSSSAHKVTEATITTDKRRFFCREWAFQKIAHCLEQRPVSKTCGALILGDAGSGKTALCQELSQPGQGPQARQQRALNRRLLARYFVQGDNENSLRPGEFVRSVAMQILSHSSRRPRTDAERDQSPRDDSTPLTNRRNSEEERLIQRFSELGDDGEESSKPLLADSEAEQRTDEEECGSGRRARTIDRIHERDTYTDSMPSASLQHDVDAALTHTDDLPEILPRSNVKATNPFINDENNPDFRLYENHENLFLRNISQRQSKEMRNSRLLRQSSEPLTDKKPTLLQKSLSTEQKNESSSESEKPKVENSPPKSRIPVANFRYPNKSELRPNSNENSPLKRLDDKKDRPVSPKADSELPEYQNILTQEEVNEQINIEKLLEKKRSENEDMPPPIPSLPVSPRTLIANAYYDKLLSEPEIQQALLPHNLEKNPDECFKKALLFPLLEIDPPKQCLFLLVDAIDEGSVSGQTQSESSDSVAALLARHQHLLPHWLLLVCTARRHCKGLTKMFTGFRKITLDELQRAHVSADVQRYVLARLDTEPKLRARVSSDSAAAAAAAAALDHLRIKSDGCLLYLEKVLDGVADGFIALREIREIPGTLNGLYLWLAQRLFHGRRFTKVRLLLDVLLAARCGVTEEMLYKCLLTKEYSVTREDFNRRLHLLRRILVMERSTGFLSIFHHSFPAWLVDVKHCTRRYLCCPPDGHAALAMYYTLDAKRLSALEIHNYVYHMTHLEQHMAAQKKNKQEEQDDALDLHTLILLWVLDSGCDVESALKRDTETKQIENTDSENNEIKPEEKELDPESEGNNSLSEPSALESLMPELVSGGEARWPRDRRVMRALLELSRAEPTPNVSDSEHLDDIQELHDLLSTDQAMEGEETQEGSAEEPEEVVVDPATVHELATRGDDDTLAILLKRYPQLALGVDAAGSTALHAAARGGRAACAALLLRAGADASAADADGWSPLRAAAWAGHSEVVEVLLEHGCDVDCVDADNRTALRAAAWSGHEGVVARLVAGGARPDLADAEGRTPLIAAAYMGHADIVRALLDAGADVDHSDADGRTALAVAALCAAGAPCAALLIERGADVHKADRDRATPLLVAAFEGHTEICELLLEAEADIEASDAAGRTALWAAASAGHARTVRLLLFWGACVDNMDPEGRTVLSTAAAQGNVEVVRQLLDRGLDEHHRDNSGWTPLHYAAFEGHIEVCEALLEAGAKVDEADNDGKGALMLAAQEGHTRLVSLLLDDWAAPVDQHAHDGKTALRLAALEGHFETVSALQERGADVDALDADRRSTLYVLALDNRLAMARQLLTCGASVHCSDSEGRTPLHVSAWQGHTEMVNLLITVGGARVDGRDRCARTALHAAAWRGRTAALKALLRHGASPSAVCTQGATPLGIAAQEGHEECVLWLLQHGADPMQADHCGRTPAKVAWRAGHANICRLLERWAAPSAPVAPAVTAAPPAPPVTVLDESPRPRPAGSPDYKRRSVHSSNSTKSSSNLTGGSARSHEQPEQDILTHDKTNRANLSLSFAQQVARCGRSRREKERDEPIPEHHAVEKDAKLRSYIANERDAELQGYARARRGRDRRREERHGCERDTSPLYASPPRSPLSDLCSPTAPAPAPAPAHAAPLAAYGSQPASLSGVQPVVTDTHFNRDTHMRIILGRDTKQPSDRHDSAVWSRRGRAAYSTIVGSIGRARGRIFKKTKNKRNGIVTNPAMRLVNNVRNGLDNAAANIRRTGVALAASASSANPAVKTNAFQWRKETPL
ncbi:PREDICTED: ankyrin repeat domain-containing protein 50 isoform X1 [Papilio polytes]|uniref:ankyrin repeat domain-containing protein 50 isoform X1 n=1 Tax=Papilio polytes TaxID=76194 RepID=UPI0006761AE8|nr:PREDICTED: ankyrin repeat domain-containing protein 50 isoform X1 [Papilio polytes]XP_013143377.1 PREDICTED: ankyrin repeat domain-containing protein 50 isoform X1 [Papilio polytes]